MDKQKGERDFSPRIRSARIGSAKEKKEQPQEEKKPEHEAQTKKVTKLSSPPAPDGRPKAAKAPRHRWGLLFSWKWLLVVLVSSLGLMLGIIGTIMVTGEFLPLERIDESGLIIFDKDNQRLIQLAKEQDPTEKRREIYHEYISLQDLKAKNKKLVDAMIKVEDVRFYQHNGVDFYALLRSAFYTLSGKKEQGGSTITMQVARKVVLGTQERTLSRKLKEIAAAWNLERTKGKDKILEAYLNRIEYGNNIYGVQTAAKVYFGKDLQKDTLTPGEIAILAGLPQGTTTYNPYLGEDNKKRLKKRQVDVLYIMARKDDMPPLISKEEEEKWSKKELPLKDKSSLYAYKEKLANLPFLELIQDEMERKYPHFKGKKLYSSNLKIYTSIDRKVQDAVNEILKNDNVFIDQNGRKMPAEKVDAGITVLNPKDGTIVAVGGGRQYRSGYQLRSVEKHQPGSTIKPLTVFSPAIEEEGYRRDSVVMDAPIEVKGKRIHNYDQRYYGLVTLEQMTKWSLNASAVQLLKDTVGLDRAFDYGKRLGLPLLPADKDFSPLALGGLTQGVSTIDMAQAYAVFPNHGHYVEAHIIKEIKVPNPDGNEETIKVDHPVKQVFSPETAAEMTYMLKKAVQDPDGSGSTHARLADGREVAGKSGTTQNKEKAWYVGFTPDLVTAVVVFNQKKEENELYELTGSGLPAKLFSMVMSQAHQGKPATTFAEPGSLPQPNLSGQEFGLKAIYEKGRVTLSWNPQGEGVKYQISRSENGEHFEDLAQNLAATSYVDEIGEPGLLDQMMSLLGSKKVYYYRVTAMDPRRPMQPTSAVVKVSLFE
ncbi:transglycosylase domain-containing protein [Thermoflavimicrobium dichotomicum]|uniref:Penicillin-binding protein 1A/penicillin-binding protein 2A n=1 Tax=Thermoflavimicrobium dichotomicum TaxID=46223 RepID=A0A1I3RIW3_9BACL|nr:transglycosylase domain-containing protein [Thermoflavimicrobium dichotomicum]SFJ46208.1 penicillin-binding protein 1A/penicillin-binding protein 2A [Thermoflavimicrobium dichotomicum]